MSRVYKKLNVSLCCLCTDGGTLASNSLETRLDTGHRASRTTGFAL